MRRKDREMDAGFARMVLDKCEWAVLATVGADGAPYCVPVTIVRDGETLYFHSAKAGEKVEDLARDGRVCLTAVGDTKIALDAFTTEFESAVVHGTAREVTGEAEKTEALRLLCQRHVPTNMGAFDDAIAQSLRRTGVWAIEMERVTGKRKKYGKDGKELKFGAMEG